MAALDRLYRSSLALHTDLYQLTMAYAHFRLGRHDDQAVFHLFFRTAPFGGRFAVAAGLDTALEHLLRLRFEEEDLRYLAGLLGADGNPLFAEDFLRALGALSFQVDIDAMPEGTVVFPSEPLLRVTGPILQCQLLETALLNILNFQTLVATKAARICEVAEGPVLEFGLRRAHGIDGGLSASRAAFIGGCAATSNVLAGQLYGIPVRGTHAHSWVMAFGDELEAFEAYAQAMPNNAVFLVDTFDTLEGVRHAIEVGRRLRERGHTLQGIRLDSGDLAWLSIQARQLLDEAGFPDAAIVASSDLDEHVIASLQMQGARISTWGVGTRLVTAYDQPALGGVYKLAAIRRSAAFPWELRIKVSDNPVKTTTPGILQVRRFQTEDRFLADEVWDEELGPPAGDTAVVDPYDETRRRPVPPGTPFQDLLLPVVRRGQRVGAAVALTESRTWAQSQLARLDPTIRRILNPHEYPVGLEPRLHERRRQMIRKVRGLPDPTEDFS